MGYSQTRAPVSAANEFHLARCMRRGAARRGAARRDAARLGATGRNERAKRSANYYGRKARRKFNRA